MDGFAISDSYYSIWNIAVQNTWCPYLTPDLPVIYMNCLRKCRWEGVSWIVISLLFNPPCWIKGSGWALTTAMVTGKNNRERIQAGCDVVQPVRLRRRYICTARIFHEYNGKGYRHLRIISFHFLSFLLSDSSRRIQCIAHNQLATLPLNQSKTLTGSEFSRVEIHLCLSLASSRSLSSSDLLNLLWRIDSPNRSRPPQLHPALTVAVIAGSPTALYCSQVKCS